MSMRFWKAEGTQMLPSPIGNAIHIGCNASDISQLVRQAEGAGGRVFDLPVADLTATEELVQRAIEIFEIPWQIVGLNSVLSVGSELYWMECDRHFVTVVDGVDRLDDPVRGELMWLLVNIVDRMRGAGDHYSVAFPERGHTDELRTALDHENEDLSAPPNFPWNHRSEPIPIVDHRTDAPSV